MMQALMAGNWKMYKTPIDTRNFFEKFTPLVVAVRHCEILICPPAINLTTAVDAARGTSVMIGAQNLHPGKEGAFTGEISGYMIKSAGAGHVIIGHSERRQYFNDNEPEVVLNKTLAALDAGLTPVVCVGELLAERESGKTEEVLVRQFREGLGSLTQEQFDKVVVAYEPVWAIGTGKTATPQIASEAHAVIRQEAHVLFGASAAKDLRILYGGSVKPDNAKALMAESEINGVLVGGASLDPESFARIVNY
jgi:triosephosphate isomerase